MGKKEEQEMHRDERIEQTGQLTLTDNKEETSIHLLTIIGEIEGHDNLGSSSKTTKYEHILPQLAAIEDSKNISGLLVLLNTMGGDVEAGLAIAEMIASLSKPTVSLVLGGSHSIGVPIAVSTDYSYIVPSGTMVIHPVRMNGTVIGAPLAGFNTLCEPSISSCASRMAALPSGRWTAIWSPSKSALKGVQTRGCSLMARPSTSTGSNA